MKLLSFILAMIILVLSCIPCCDAEGIATQQTSTSTIATSGTEHAGKTNQEHKDLCSPFCQCSCCAIACMIPALQMTNVIIRPVFSDQVFAVYLQHNPIAISLPIWQPPKIAAHC